MQSHFETARNARAEADLPPLELKSISPAAATVWGPVVAGKDELGGRYLEDCAGAPIVDMPNPFADRAREYALDHLRAEALWVRSEQLIGIV